LAADPCVNQIKLAQKPWQKSPRLVSKPDGSNIKMPNDYVKINLFSIFQRKIPPVKPAADQTFDIFRIILNLDLTRPRSDIHGSNEGIRP
jgi:hypothetical protein